MGAFMVKTLLLLLLAVFMIDACAPNLNVQNRLSLLHKQGKLMVHLFVLTIIKKPTLFDFYRQDGPTSLNFSYNATFFPGLTLIW